MAATNKLREELAQKFLEALNQGHIPWQACWNQGRPESAITGKVYRGVNAVSLSYAADDRGYSDPRWCTYRQAQEKGWQVRKGEKGARVEYWAYYDLKEKKLLSWQDVRSKLKADPDYEKNLQLRCRIYTVFNAQQIDGIPALEERPQTDIGTLRAHRDILIQNLGIGYEEHGNRAYYSPSTDSVTLPPEASFDDTYSYMATFLHECGHASGAPHRLNRDLSGFFGSESYAREELRAEIASAFTAQSLGLQLTPDQLAHHTQLHAAYVQHWATILKDAPDELFRAIKAAEGISDYLIEKGEFNLEHKQIPQLVKIETDQQREILVAIESTDDYADANFHAELHNPEQQNPDGSYGTPVDYYRLVKIGDSGRIEVLDKDLVFATEAQAKAAAESIPYARLVDYDTLVHEAGRNLTAKYTLEEIPDSQDLRLRFHGYGKIQDYSSAEARPWQAQIGRIREVVIEDGILKVGRNVLNAYPNLEKVTWSTFLERTGPDALQNCPSLKEIAFSRYPECIVEAHDLTSPHVLLNLANRYPDLMKEQLTVVAKDLRDGASWEEISVYAKPDFSSLQMDAIRYARDSGLTPEQLEVVANPRFLPVQMDIIRNGFLWGMTMEQVQTFAQPGVTPYGMLRASATIRGELTAEETALMERWGAQTAQGMEKLAADLMAESAAPAVEAPTLTMGG